MVIAPCQTFFTIKKNTRDDRHAVVVSRKVMGGAVKRNRARRRIRHTLQEHENIPPIVVIIHKDVSALSHEELVDCIQTTLRDRGLIRA